MKFIPPAIFAIALTVALIVIWKTIQAALPAIRSLRSQLRGDEAFALSPSGQPVQASMTLRKAALDRPRRHLKPKPVTHRLHHFTDELVPRRRMSARA